MLEAGNSLAPRRIPAGEEDQRWAKAELIARSWEEAGLDALALGAQDWQLGGERLRGLVREMPVLAANLRCADQAPFPATRVVERGGWSVGLIGLSAGEPEGCVIGDPVEAVRDAVAGLPEVDLRVLLAPLGSGALDRLGDVDVDLVVDGAGGRLRRRADELGQALVVSAGSRAKYLVRATVHWEPEGRGLVATGQAEALNAEVERLAARLDSARQRARGADEAGALRLQRQVEHYEQALQRARARRDAAAAEPQQSGHRLELEALALSEEIEDHPETAARVAARMAALSARADAPAASGSRRVERGPYAGGDACAGCHPAAQAQWEQTGHARAWQALVEDHRAGDLECYRCHATGVGQRGGPSSPATVGGLRDVQCEACHGAARAHVLDPSRSPPQARPALAGCVRCHDGERDGGRFDPESYWQRILHGRE